MAQQKWQADLEELYDYVSSRVDGDGVRAKTAFDEYCSQTGLPEWKVRTEYYKMKARRNIPSRSGKNKVIDITNAHAVAIYKTVPVEKMTSMVGDLSPMMEDLIKATAMLEAEYEANNTPREEEFDLVHYRSTPEKYYTPTIEMESEEDDLIPVLSELASLSDGSGFDIGNVLRSLLPLFKTHSNGSEDLLKQLNEVRAELDQERDMRVALEAEIDGMIDNVNTLNQHLDEFLRLPSLKKIGGLEDFTYGLKVLVDKTGLVKEVIRG